MLQGIFSGLLNYISTNSFSYSAFRAFNFSYPFLLFSSSLLFISVIDSFPSTCCFFSTLSSSVFSRHPDDPLSSISLLFLATFLDSPPFTVPARFPAFLSVLTPSLCVCLCVLLCTARSPWAASSSPARCRRTPMRTRAAATCWSSWTTRCPLRRSRAPPTPPPPCLDQCRTTWMVREQNNLTKISHLTNLHIQLLHLSDS